MIIAWIIAMSIASVSCQELKLLHVLFSHKLYAPVKIQAGNSFNCPSNLDYQSFLQNADDMSNAAKMDMFELGVFLRTKYGAFLGELYYPEVMRVQTTKYVLSMISAQLLNAGLWPPAKEQIWNDDLDWQPIPTDYKQADQDSLLLGTLCPRFLDEEDQLHQDKSVRSMISAHEPLYQSLSKMTEMQIQRPSDVALLYSCLETNADVNATLPDWTTTVYPDGELKNVTLLAYDLLSQTTVQKQLNGGAWLKRVINESIEHESSNGTSKRKLFMYSGEERNLIGVLQGLKLWEPHILKRGASLIIEIYQNSSTSKQYSVKIVYYFGMNLTKTLVLDGCTEYCPLEKFSELVKNVLPDDEENLCLRAVLKKPEDNSSSRLTCSFFLYFILFYHLICL